MLRFLFVALALVLSLHAISDNELLKRADKFMNAPSKTNQFRAYNDYKNLYLRALMSENEKLRTSALHGIIKSGTQLHIDVSQYSDELSKLKPQTKYKAPESKSEIKKSEKIKVTSSHKLKSVRWQENRLLLNFDKNINNNQLNYFTLHDEKKSVYKYVFDIHASMLTQAQNLKKSDVDRIKIAQYDTDTLRLVIENNQKLKISFKKELSSLVINIEAEKITPKQVPIPKQVLAQKQITSKLHVVVPKTLTPKRLDRSKTIVIDAGHGGKDPGAVGYRKYREKIVALQVSNQLKSILVSRGYKVHMTRDNDKFVKLGDRTKFANKKSADLFISIHANAVDKKKADVVHGIECYFLDKSRSSRAKRVAAQENSADMSEMDFYGKESFLHTLSSHNIIAANKLAIDLQRGMLNSLRKKYTNVKDGGVRPAPFWVLVGAQMPAVLVEIGFITNPMEAQRLVDKEYQKQLSMGLANGIERYFLNN